MTSPPPQPRIYHITHVENLPSILANGGILSDSAMAERDSPATVIGMSTIKTRRLALPVKCHPGDCVADHVPFYFCPRSIMLFIIHRGNHSELAYLGGQRPVIHLEADLHEAVAWADSEGHRWAFSLSNAGATYAEFRNRLDQLDELDWTAIAATDFRDKQVQEGKQAEFLMHGFFPWHLVRRIGAQSVDTHATVLRALTVAGHRPLVDVLPVWYF